MFKVCTDKKPKFTNVYFENIDWKYRRNITILVLFLCCQEQDNKLVFGKKVDGLDIHYVSFGAVTTHSCSIIITNGTAVFATINYNFGVFAVSCQYKRRTSLILIKI